MSIRQSTEPIYLAPIERYSLQAYSAPSKLDLKAIESTFREVRIERCTQYCVAIHHGENKIIFVFKFGTVVFFNIPTAEHSPILERLNVSPHLDSKVNDDIARDEFSLNVREGVTQVGFNSVTIPSMSTSHIQLVAHVLAQSNALELTEWEVEEFLAESERMAKPLQRRGLITGTRQKLMKFLGNGLVTRHRIVTQLAIFEDPEPTWDTEELNTLYEGLLKTFDIKERISRIEKMLSLSTEATELLLEISNSRRQELLEMIIIALIALEIVRPVLG